MATTPLDDILTDEPEKKEGKAEELKIPKLGEETPSEGDISETAGRSRRKAWQQKERDTREAAEGRVRDPETGQYVTKEEKPSTVVESPPAVDKEPEKPKEEAQKEAQQKQEFNERERAFLRAAQEERQKRQELERQIKELSQKPVEEQKAFWDDPEGHFKKFEQRMAAVANQTRLQTAELIARSKHPDFDEKLEVFATALQQNPALVQQWLGSPDPGEFAYRTGKTLKDLQDAGSVENLRAKMEVEIKAKLEAEMKAKSEKEAAERKAIPESLSAAPSTPQKRAVWGGPTPLEDVLNP